MDITFNCDKCGQSIVIDEAGAGLQVQCPKCSESLTVLHAKPPQDKIQPVPIAVQLRGLRKLTIADVLGDIGECAATDWLGKQGYRVCRADVIENIGHSLWIRDSLSECDCQRLTLLTGMCAERPKCGVPNVPCQNAANEFFAFNPSPPQFLPGFILAEGDNHFRHHYCGTHLSYLAITGQCDSTCDVAPCFIKAYLQINAYIKNLYSLHATSPERRKHFGLDPTDPIWLPARDSAQWTQFWSGHPGRIDFFGVKDGEPVCLEVKANKGRLSRWQFIRLQWMKNQGFNANIVRVKLDTTSKNELLRLFNDSKKDEAFAMSKPECHLEEIDGDCYEDFRQLVPDPQKIQEYNTKCSCWAGVRGGFKPSESVADTSH